MLGSKVAFRAPRAYREILIPWEKMKIRLLLALAEYRAMQLKPDHHSPTDAAGRFRTTRWNVVLLSAQIAVSAMSTEPKRTCPSCGIEFSGAMAMQRFEHYQLVTGEDGKPVELGRGAMGVTYKAFDIDLHRPVSFGGQQSERLGLFPLCRIKLVFSHAKNLSARSA
jgi:hypothetical protein